MSDRIMDNISNCANGETDDVTLTTKEASEFIAWLKDKFRDYYNDGFDDAMRECDRDPFECDWDDHDIHLDR